MSTMRQLSISRAGMELQRTDYKVLLRYKKINKNNALLILQ